MNRRLTVENLAVQLLAVMGIALLLRVLFLGSKSLWFDEAFSVVRSQLPLGSIWRPAIGRPESHPPLYYTFLHYWILWQGGSETAVRFPSAVMSTINVALLYGLGRRLADPRVGVLAAALLATSPLNVWYAQEARMYVFVTGAGLLFALLLTWDSWWAMPALALALITGLYVDYTMLPLWAGISAVWLVWWWQRGHSPRPFICWLAASFAMTLAFWPWLPEFRKVLESFHDIQIFEALNKTIGMPFLAPAHYLLLMVGVSLLLIPLTLLVQRLLRNGRWFQISAIATLFVVVAITVLVPAPRGYALKRLLVLVWPYALLLAAWFTTQLPQRRFVSSALLITSLIASLVSIFLVAKDDWRSAIAFINTHAAPDAIVYFDPFWTDIMGVYYPLEPQSLGVRADLASAPAAHEIWLIASRFPGQAVPSSATEASLDAMAELEQATPFYRLEVRRYSR